MVTATFYYRSRHSRTITLSRGYGEPMLAHELVTVILTSAELPLLLDEQNAPLWIDRKDLVGWAVMGER